MTAPVPELVYDAALRVITRESQPDDADRLAGWNPDPALATTREVALEALRRAAEGGIARPVRG